MESIISFGHIFLLRCEELELVLKRNPLDWAYCGRKEMFLLINKSLHIRALKVVDFF